MNNAAGGGPAAQCPEGDRYLLFDDEEGSYCFQTEIVRKF
jgi:hypothetical protein